MPEPDAGVISQRQSLVAALRKLLPEDCVIDDERGRRAFECDGLSAYRALPMIVVLPRDTGEVSRVLALCHERGVKIVPRGAGTGLSGGALPLAGRSHGRLRQAQPDPGDRHRQPLRRGAAGGRQPRHQHGREPHDFYYAPDPSSQIACSIGGNVAENSGGVHCLKYGLTTNNLLGIEMVLMDGEVLRLGGKQFDAEGYDMLGVVTGSEGLLGVVTEVTVRILPKPASVRALLLGFPDNASAGACVGEIIAAGIIPAGLEMMDKPAIEAAESFCQPGYPMDVASILICELDGPEVEVDELVALVGDLARKSGATTIRASRDEAERERFWLGRKTAFGAAGRMAPDYYVMDGTIPRARLPEVLTRIGELSREYGLPVANVFHAGDGNLHPLIMYDSSIPGALQRTEEMGSEILKLCVEVGGVLTGEHGVGVEKRDLMGAMFTDDDLKQQQRIKCAFDPEQLLNPGKVFPTLHRCAELGQMHVHRGETPFPDLPRF